MLENATRICDAKFGVLFRYEVDRSGWKWFLARDASGRRVVHIEIGACLIAAGNEPEEQELLRLIGTLV